MIEPLAVAVHACRRAEITAGQSVLICGAGAIGLVNLLTCKAMEHRKSGAPDVTSNLGAPKDNRLAIKVTKSGGVVMMVGLGASEVKIPTVEATVREVDIKGIYRYANCFPIALELVSSGAVDIKPIITNVFNIEDVHKAFKTAQLGSDGAIKVLVKCSQ
ncbi:sorbitol dehydrogenase [Trichonephila inaurata madagascariensis]|uniref:Sorbitol dehydrogenase n=1 Tax=Trichonephila inaurata madagascariensis TaxID=2747483 RepID=A0A8X6WN43_9ARAC|nr:sorbitol dehydrogenase [Trichonephila inaurata madagascariensis]